MGNSVYKTSYSGLKILQNSTLYVYTRTYAKRLFRSSGKLVAAMVALVIRSLWKEHWDAIVPTIPIKLFQDCSIQAFVVQ